MATPVLVGDSPQKQTLDENGVQDVWEVIPGSTALGIVGSCGLARQLMEGITDQVSTGASGTPSPGELLRV